MTALAGARHPHRSVDPPTERFVPGRTVGGCWIRELTSDGGHNGPFDLRCCCGWHTPVEQGAERYLTEALAAWRTHAAAMTATEVAW